MSWIIKIAMTVGAVGFWLYTQKLLGQRKMPFHGGVEDFVHVWTAKWNRSLNKNTQLANFLLISSSLIVDALGLFLIVQTFIGPTLRPLLGLVFVFTLRQINQAITMLPTPEGMIWRDPGVPSLFVTYGVSNDLFFSGHTALAVLGALELGHLPGALFTALAGFVIFYEVAVVLVLRAHWTMDVFAGAVTALWGHQLVSEWVPALDSWLAQF